MKGYLRINPYEHQLTYLEAIDILIKLKKTFLIEDNSIYIKEEDFDEITSSSQWQKRDC